MIYLYDLALPLPTKDLYDTLIMQMAVAAAKDMYDRGEKRIDDFYKKYEDFYSPISGATEDVYNTGIGRVKGIILDLYSKGIDPLRSSEGRAIIALAIRDTDIAKINARKLEAEFAKEYIKNRNIAILNGTYDPDVERAINHGKLLEEWTADDGYWTSTSPIKYVSKDEMIAPLAEALTPEFDAVLTAQRKDGFDYKTVSDNRIREMINDNIDDLITKGQMGQYYYNEALKQTNNNPTAAKELLKEQLFQAARKHTKETREANPYTMSRMKTDEAIRAAKAEAAIKHYYEDLQWDIDGDGELDDTERGYKRQFKEAQIKHLLNGRKTSEEGDDIFDVTKASPGTYQPYIPKDAYNERISPSSSKIIQGTDNGYYISKDDIRDAMDNFDIVSANGNALNINSLASSNENRYFTPTGKMVYIPRLKRSNTGKVYKDNTEGDWYVVCKYTSKYATGKKTKDSKGRETDKPEYDYKQGDIGGSNSGMVLIKVKRRNYDKQKK